MLSNPSEQPDAPVNPEVSVAVNPELNPELNPETAPSDEVAELRAQVDALLNDPLDEWIEKVHFGGASAAGYERTLSWRITKPLRLARTFQMRVNELGLPTALSHAARLVKRRLPGLGR